MSYKTITAGNKVGKAKAARFIESKGGTLGVEVAFEFKEGDAMERLSWVGWCSERALQYTMKTLTDVLDFNGDENFGPGAINTEKDVILVVELEPGQGDNAGKTFPKIAFVNNADSSRFAGAAPETVKSKLQSVGFKAAFMAAKSEKKGGGGTPPTGTDPNNDNLPF